METVLQIGVKCFFRLNFFLTFMNSEYGVKSFEFIYSSSVCTKSIVQTTSLLLKYTIPESFTCWSFVNFLFWNTKLLNRIEKLIDGVVWELSRDI